MCLITVLPRISHIYINNVWTTGRFAPTEAGRWNSPMFRSSVSELLCRPLSASIFPLSYIKQYKPSWWKMASYLIFLSRSRLLLWHQSWSVLKKKPKDVWAATCSPWHLHWCQAIAGQSGLSGVSQGTYPPHWPPLHLHNKPPWWHRRLDRCQACEESCCRPHPSFLWFTCGSLFSATNIVILRWVTSHRAFASESSQCLRSHLTVINIMWGHNKSGSFFRGNI